MKHLPLIICKDGKESVNDGNPASKRGMVLPSGCHLMETAAVLPASHPPQSLLSLYVYVQTVPAERMELPAMAGSVAVN